MAGGDQVKGVNRSLDGQIPAPLHVSVVCPVSLWRDALCSVVRASCQAVTVTSLDRPSDAEAQPDVVVAFDGDIPGAGLAYKCERRWPAARVVRFGADASPAYGHVTTVPFDAPVDRFVQVIQGSAATAGRAGRRRCWHPWR